MQAPDFEVKKKRGGKRHRQMKERFGLTEMRKARIRARRRRHSPRRAACTLLSRPGGALLDCEKIAAPL